MENIYCEDCDKHFKNKAGLSSHNNSKAHRRNVLNNFIGKQPENQTEEKTENIINYKDVISPIIKDNDITEYEGFKNNTYLTYT